ncbi:YHS domain-containing (seleno)protein [uncultured Roseovarius sp.]|uniref:YHS domain-containing (seleno)protein n=1 Tax=Roseovarius sp. TaxID=1486281 RepID=UPI0025E5F94A|nr:YHS domain-containing (seleno)protein [uncultured Roseovarius sp.]
MKPQLIKDIANWVAILTVASAVTFTFATWAYAADEYNVVNGHTLAGQPLGLHGVDPVSMFGDQRPLTGDASLTASHDGIDYYFASAATKQAFEVNPTSYLPQFGGFCAFGVFVGKKLDGDVRYVDIVDGKLYLFVNAAILAKYREDPEAVIAGAKAKWPGIVNTPVNDL